MTTIFLAEDVAKDEGYFKPLPDGRCISYPDPLSPFAKALRLPLAKRPAGWQTLSPEPWTVGYGVCGPDVTRSTVWTQPQAYARLLMAIRQTESELDRAIPWWRTMSDPRQDTFCEASFNMGVPHFLGFKQTLAAAQAQNWPLAAAELLDSDAARDLPSRYTRLARQLHDGVHIAA